MEKIASSTYPEAPSALHSNITSKAIEHLFTNYILADNAMVLDVGCGQAVALKHFTEHKCRPVGITLNQTDLEECRRLGYTVAQMDQSFLDFEDATFNLVWARHVVEHSIFPYFTLTEFARVLKPGGMLYLEVPGAETACRHENNPNHYSILSHRMWFSLLERSGFSISEEQKYFLKNDLGPDEYWAFYGMKFGENHD
jgi:SAM-dependent methyltransferase